MRPETLKHPKDNELRKALEDFINLPEEEIINILDNEPDLIAYAVFEDVLKAYFGENMLNWIENLRQKVYRNEDSTY